MGVTQGLTQRCISSLILHLSNSFWHLGLGILQACTPLLHKMLHFLRVTSCLLKNSTSFLFGIGYYYHYYYYYITSQWTFHSLQVSPFLASFSSLCKLTGIYLEQHPSFTKLCKKARPHFPDWSFARVGHARLHDSLNYKQLRNMQRVMRNHASFFVLLPTKWGIRSH